jgi:pyruvate dehydrogenase E2 component (dihydrolipoamide acetyltransferase)
MAFEFKLPDLGEGIHEAQVLGWKVSPGQEVKAFDPLVEVESAKAAVELTAPVAGKVMETRFAEGDIAHLGDVLVVIDTDGSQPAEWFGIVGSAPKQSTTKSTTNKVRAAPFVRKLARERGINLEDVRGSGPQGRVRIADLEPPREAPAPTGVPLRGLRKSIADHMVDAWRNAPQVTSMDLFDATELVRAREALLGSAEGVKLTYLPFVVKACVAALRAVPEANAVVTADAIKLNQEYHIGIATAVPGGLVVPVVRNADQLSLFEVAQEIDRLVTAARDRKATPQQLSGSTFTITSYGGLPGSALFATPILNYPEVAILGIGRVDWQPRVVNGAVVPRQCVGVSFTFDHRVLDGEGAGRFMVSLRKFIEQPLELLLHLR